MVVFAFLVLPALAALRLGRSMLMTFAVAAGIATVSSVGGFALSYRADLPTGPVYVLVAAAIWLLVSLAMRLRGRSA
jgi:zinc transport system permease protein